MRGMYLVELEAKLQEEPVFLSDATLQDGMFGLDGLFMRVIERAEKKKDIDTIVVYLSEDDDLINLWELSVTAISCKKELWSLVDTMREFIESKERKNHGNSSSRKAFAL